MHYIYGIRKGVDSKTSMLTFGFKLFFSDIAEVFNTDKLQAVLDQVPEQDRHDLYYTCSRTHPVIGRDFIESDIIQFDIDDIDREQAERVARVAIRTLGVDWDKTAVVFSGNGVQFFIRKEFPIVNASYYSETRTHYHMACQRITEALSLEGLAGEADTSVWDAKRLMRLPLTQNRKREPYIQSAILQGNLKVQSFDLVAYSGLETVTDIAEDTDQGVRYFGSIDSKGVQEGCDFIKYARENQDSIKEPQWYAALGIIGRLENGEALAHEYSKGHKSYTFDRTTSKLRQALQSSGPRTCKNINTLWDKCKSCANFGLVKTPLHIKGADFIGTKDSGFRVLNDKGARTKPAFEDLLKEFALEYNFVTVEEGHVLMVYKDTHWHELSDISVQSWVTHKLVPMAAPREASDFVSMLKNQKVISRKVMDSRAEGHINFANGILRTETLELMPHDPRHMMQYCLPHAYNPKADCPTWDKFMMQVFDNQEQVIELMNSYIGYCFSGDSPWLQKCIALIGDGSNGKSTIINTMKYIVGPDNMASLPIDSLDNMNTRAKVINKLFVFSEETSARALQNNEEVFKALVVGGAIEVKRLYKDVIDYEPKAKVIISANQDLTTNDRTYGLVRRLIFIPMNKVFIIGKNADIGLEAKLKSEACGIFNKCLAYYRQTKERGRLDIPDSITKVLDDWRYENNPIEQFNDECVEFTDRQNDFTSSKDLYVAYDNYCRSNGVRAMNSTNFGKGFTKVLEGRMRCFKTRDENKRGFSRIKLKEL